MTKPTTPPGSYPGSVFDVERNLRAVPLPMELVCPASTLVIGRRPSTCALHQRMPRPRSPASLRQTFPWLPGPSGMLRDGACHLSAIQRAAGILAAVDVKSP